MKCKCGGALFKTNTFPIWVYCKKPNCDYVVMIGQAMVDSLTGSYGENEFATEGPFKGHLQASPFLKKITDIKPNYVEVTS